MQRVDGKFIKRKRKGIRTLVAKENAAAYRPLFSQPVPRYYRGSFVTTDEFDDEGFMVVGIPIRDLCIFHQHLSMRSAVRVSNH